MHILHQGFVFQQSFQYIDRKIDRWRMIITGHFQPSLLTWKDWSRGTIQDLTARLGLSVRISPMLFQKITSIDLSYEVLLN